MSSDKPGRPSRCLTNQSPQLPPELWIQIIASITDSRYLPRVWLNFRRVCRSFKAITEQVFADEHLPRSRLEFPGFDPVTDEHRTPRDLDFALHFDHVSEDGTRAIYTKNGDGHGGSVKLLGGSRTVHEERVLQWQAKVTAYQAPPPVSRRDVPPHILVVGRVANDTELPGLEVRYAQYEASFLWRPALSSLFGEEEYRKWAARQEAQHSHAGATSERDGEPSRRSDTKVRQMRVRRFFRRHGKDLAPGSFADTDYARKSLEVYSLQRDLAKIIAVDEWAMGEQEESKGIFYDGEGTRFPVGDPENEPGEGDLFFRECMTENTRYSQGLS